MYHTGKVQFNIFLPPAGVPMLAPKPVTESKMPYAGPRCSTSIRSAVKIDDRKPKTPENKRSRYVSGYFLIIAKMHILQQS